MANNLTDKEIKKALECCSEANNCGQCEYEPTEHQIGSIGCSNELMKDVLDLINRQEFRIHQQEKTIMEIQHSNLIDFKATIGNYIAENESIKAEVERMWLCIDELKKLVGKHEPNYDPSEEVDAIIQSTIMVKTPNIKANILNELVGEEK